MKKIAERKLSKSHYTADACIVWCFDDRFSPALEEFVKKCRIKKYDLVKVAGGAKCLSSFSSESERDFLLFQIKASLKLHKAKKVVLMLHSDCGACGGLKAFDSDVSAEKSFQIRSLKKAKEYLEENLPDNIKIELIFVDFKGIYLCE